MEVIVLDTEDRDMDMDKVTDMDMEMVDRDMFIEDKEMATEARVIETEVSDLAIEIRDMSIAIREEGIAGIAMITEVNDDVIMRVSFHFNTFKEGCQAADYNPLFFDNGNTLQIK